MAPSKTRVSIAMPVFNGGKDLALAVRSIRAQSFENWELIIIDDGSTDGAVSALSRLKDTRIRIFQDNQNRGLAVRLNEAISYARGHYIARMDHDDICHPDRLLKQTAFLDEHPDVDLLASRCVAISADNKVVGRLPFAEDHVDIARHPWKGFYMPHPTWMARASWFRQFPYADPAPYRCEDQELLLRACPTSTYHALPEDLLAYRLHAKVPFEKLFRTRAALGRLQLAQFWANREFTKAFQSVAMTCTRVSLDILNGLAARFQIKTSFLARSSTDGSAQFWQSYISTLTKVSESTTLHD